MYLNSTLLATEFIIKKMTAELARPESKLKTITNGIDFKYFFFEGKIKERNNAIKAKPIEVINKIIKTEKLTGDQTIALCHENPATACGIRYIPYKMGITKIIPEQIIIAFFKFNASYCLFLR